MDFGIKTDLWVGWEEMVGLSPFGKIHLEEADLTGKWAIVTGGSMGIGIEACKMLAGAGCNVIVASRGGQPGSDKGAKIVQAIHAAGIKRGTEVEFWPIDGEQLSDVKAFADRWLKTKKPLDYLITNHGIAEPKIALSSEGYERHYVINFLSHALLTLLLLPSLAAAKAPRIVAVSSCFHYFGRAIDWSRLSTKRNERWYVAPFSPLPGFMMKYGRSKLLLSMFIRELSIRLAEDERYRHIIAHSVHPGCVSTAIFRDLYDWRKPFLTMGAAYLYYIGITPEEGAKALYKACISDDEERTTRGGGYFNRAWRRQPRPEVDDKATRLKLWDRIFTELPLKENQIFKK